ncbi:Periplasmic binding protein-like II [Glarea lozoyensis ATCC 20868]|uniref:Periplasmic binding protein-like II n=1 Tax=Glarea lozoyensis (strain ATCC 20868 / MF5171) TaxID=1116229 RepID=S3D6V0_GLAL2|nr:Periplasmic binding protein-like II [Glarea lozoyensis ATCC 20868]EPE33515.1 Periplasmic binding protein-like II [Glarea lozoyensis ATCC 20868]
MTTKPLRIGFVPEHFSTPLHYATTHFSLSATLIPFPSGTGHMITSLRSGEIDIGIGLTEGWIAGLGKDGGSTEGDSKDGGYRIVGTYVETPLCWAISTGPKRDINGVEDLEKNNKIGVSRIGSGSYVMGFVLADQRGWLGKSEKPFEVVPLGTFDKLRKGVADGTADFFMWEHFTSKRYYDNGEIKRIGEIYTPWPSWQIVASTSTSPTDDRLSDLFTKLDQGIKHFNENPEESVKYISTSLDYSEKDAREWLKTVKFANGTKGVDVSVVEKTLGILRKAGVVGESGMKEKEMSAITRT